VLSVMNGFESELRGRLLSLSAHATVTAVDGRKADWAALTRRLETGSAVPLVGVAPYIELQALLSYGQAVRGAIVRGIEPALAVRVADLGRHMRAGRLDDLRPGEFGVVLGGDLARALGALPGDRIALVAPQGQVTPAGVIPRLKQFTVVGTFEAGFNEADAALALVHLADAQKVYQMGDAVSGLRLKLDDLLGAREVGRELLARLGESPAVLQALALALDQLSRTAQILGDWHRAAAAAEDSLGIHRRLASRLGETPDSLRGLALALDRAGHAAQALGDWYRAGAVYEESLSLRQLLARRLGDSPDALRDLSVALDNIGRVAEAQGDWARGTEAYEEALTLRRQLIEQQGGLPERLAQSRAQLAQGGAAPELEADLASTLLDAAALPGPRAEAYREEAGQILTGLCGRHPGVDRYRRLLQRCALSNAKSAAPTVPSDTPPDQPQAGSSSP